MTGLTGTNVWLPDEECGVSCRLARTLHALLMGALEADNDVQTNGENSQATKGRAPDTPAKFPMERIKGRGQ